jgi:hypothetical protein
LRPFFFLLTVLLLFSATAANLQAQEESRLTINLLRNFGTGIGSNIKGTFTIRTNGPDDLEQVTFYLDGEPLGVVTAPPFNLRFQTDDYPTGTHTIHATGLTTDGRTLPSNTLTRNFLSPADNIKSILLLVVPLLLLVFGGRYVSNWIANRGQQPAPAAANINGSQGGAICPKCHKPFARHWWAPNLISGKYDRCPHCHKWSLVTRQPPELLQASLEAMQQADPPEPDAPGSDDTSFNRRLDDSRYDA